MQQRIVTLQNITHYYRRAIHIYLNEGKALYPRTAVNLFAQLYRDYAVQEILPERGTADVLLFRYGIFDEGDERGPYFGLDLVRRMKLVSGTFQLSLTLTYDPTPFRTLVPDEIRSWMGPGDWVDDIIENEAYHQALRHELQTYILTVSPVD